MRHVLGCVPRQGCCSDAFSKCCSRTCVRRELFFGSQLPAWGVLVCPSAPAAVWVSARAGRQPCPVPTLIHPSSWHRDPGTSRARSLLTVVFSSWSQSPESLCRFHGNSLAGGNRFLGVEGAGSWTGTGQALGRACGAQAILRRTVLALGLVPGLEQAPALHRPSHLLLLPFPFCGEAQRDFPGSSEGAQGEPSRAEGTTSGELLREGDSLGGSGKEQGFF